QELSESEAEKIEQERFARSLAEKPGQLRAPEWKGDIIHYDHTPRPRHEEQRERGRRWTRSDYRASRQHRMERDARDRRPAPRNEPGGAYAKGEGQSLWGKVVAFFFG